MGDSNAEKPLHPGHFGVLSDEETVDGFLGIIGFEMCRRQGLQWARNLPLTTLAYSEGPGPTAGDHRSRVFTA